LAFVAAIWWSVQRAHLAGVTKGFIFDTAVVVLVSSLVGARLTYVVHHWEMYRRHPLDIISPVQSDGTIGIAGMVLLGGVIAAFVAGGYFLKRRRVSFWAMADLVSPPVALGIAIGRMGCFLNGCCFGHPTESPFGMVFPEGCYAAAVYPEVSIHPTQLYAAVAALSIAIVLMILERQSWAFRGMTLSWFLIFYGVDRFVVEGYRYYEPGWFFHLLGTQWTGSRLISAGMVMLGIVTMILLPKKPPMEKAVSPKANSKASA
jgi:phosphatidylglycerol:prolipoprotein diacylglycerol transferase